MQQQISPTTAKIYLRRGYHIYMQAREAKGGDVSPAELADYLLSRRHTVCKHSWRVYRAATVFTLRAKSLPLNNVDDVEVSEAIERLEKASLLACRRATGTSAGRRKEITENAMAKISQTLLEASRQDRKNGVSLHTLYFLWASSFTGLRPSEWRDAQLTNDEGKKSVRVRTAKQKPDQAKPNQAMKAQPFRDVPVETNTQLVFIRKHLRLIDAWCNSGRGTIDSYIQACRSCLRRTVVSLFGQEVKVVLYDCRHQYITNQRTAGVDQDTLAVRVGHTSLKTTNGYGKRKGTGWGGKQIVRTRRMPTQTSKQANYAMRSHA